MIKQPRHINMRKVEEEAALVSETNVILCKFVKYTLNSEFELMW
jgi:hypothetical protein